MSNKADNSVDNSLDNKVSNKVENTVDNKVNVDVNVDVKASGLSSPVIDLHGINNIHDSVIIPEVVNQNLNGGNSNAFDINQINNLVNDNEMTNPSVSYNGSSSWDNPGGSFHMDAKAEGGDSKVDSKMGDVIGNAASGVASHADATLTQSAFDQTITQGANIQFNTSTIQAAGHDLQDSHDLHG
ncbi:MAG: hypothetical protein G4V63_31790 [Candidatus Afipia apatlaquensis]|uniref:Uncharacterized protein n=1 Tax=Candidatus Afipia apatlaquensis TaxID=2712852 RepID=A0A7C9RKB2_9BRAD|nr:hypothetical protein [Candidatus Afipia apatlaquensis]